ncbi:prolipoprotein diacylglyceryl transferase [Thermosulfuriphilus sp.]
MLPYPKIDPEILRIGPLSIRWYGLMYVVGFSVAYLMVKRELLRLGRSGLIPRLDSLLFYLVLGLIAGARLGYVLFYNLDYYLKHPLEIPATWHGGMSFHGGLLGAVLAGVIWCRRHREDFFFWADRFVLPAPIGLGLGRIANFINGELYGRVTQVPWAMVFPQGGPLPRHPSQLYEAFLEGPVLLSIMWVLRKKDWPSGVRLGVFLISYAGLRFFVEFFREPDPQLGFVLGPLTMGQILSLIMFFAGVFLLKWRLTAVNKVG